MGITTRNVAKKLGDPPNRILSDINLDIRDGEFVALTGRSGSGKSTLLYLLSSLDNPTEGTIEVDGQDLQKLANPDLCRFRNENVGFVFQFHYLLAELTALENVLFPAQKYKQADVRKDDAAHLLDQFGLGDKFNRLPRQLSGGEQQRVAIARSLIMNPKYLFADEPTGSLDTANSETVMNILRESNQKQGTTVILVTHDPGYAKLAQRQIHLTDGRVTPPEADRPAI
jgi:ABC-type lipoprotein export system ATPase subunit